MAVVAPALQYLLRSRLRPVLLGGVVFLIIAQIVALSPSSLEQVDTAPALLDPEAIISEDIDEKTLAEGIPKDRIAEYGVNEFHYVSTHAGQKQWKLLAARALMFDKEKLVHARKVTAYLYDPDGKTTVVTGREAKYFMNARDLEIYGDVRTVMTDGFEVRSEYLRYQPGLPRIDIPVKYKVTGRQGEPKPADPVASPLPSEPAANGIEFDSYGMEFAMREGVITLPSQARVRMNDTRIESDRAVILRQKQVAHFTMDAGRPMKTRFVKVKQPTLETKSRRADLSYGDFNEVLNYLVAYDDVVIQELGNAESHRYATGGQADFDAKKNVIILRKFPQVYQDHDTVAGDVIVMHRDSDIIEVEHSNSFSQGGR